jgi:hypothetical protein
MDEVKTVVTERAGVEPAAAAASEVGAVTVVTMPAWQIAGVRTVRVYLQSLLGFLTAAGTGYATAIGVVMPVGDFGHLFVVSASLAVAPAAFTLLQNVIELLAKIDASNPTLRG